jgi:hypothetical protein
MVLDKKKPSIGSIRGINFTVVKPTTVSEWLNKLRHNLLYKSALKGPLYILYKYYLLQ